jgi:beta-galactosidase
MRKIYLITATIILILFSCQMSKADNIFNLNESFESSKINFNITGKGSCKIENGVLVTKNAYATFGNPEWSNYEIKFKARTPKSEQQVQIWAGFRAHNRNDRYIVGLKGGLQNDLYLSRMGNMGTDEFLGLANLDFQPETGNWYEFRIVVCGQRIQIFLNNESLPRIDVIDKNTNLAPSGEVILGGGWIETEYDNLSINSIPNDYLSGRKVQEYQVKTTLREKITKREQERSSYKSIIVNSLSKSRTEVSLDGQWLFMPTYELNDEKVAVSPSVDDKAWHTITVPNFWNPIRIWLHGETMGKFPKGVSDTYYQKETQRCEDYTFDYTKTKAAWYRQWIELPENINGKNLELVFDAVSKVAEVFINGTKAGANVGMFGEFRVDGTRLFKPGKNLLTVKVTRDYIENIESADKIVDVAVSVPVTNKMLKDIAHGFYVGDPAGIWQPVNLIITDPLKINDIYIKPTLTGATFDVTVKNNGNKKSKFTIKTSIVDKATKQIFFDTVGLKKIELKAGEEKVFTYSINGLKPKLWSPQSPNLYDFSFVIINGKTEIDKSTICSGFRTFESKDGFLYLNGIQYWLRGANHTPFALAPNDEKLANKFFQLMKEGNMDVTRTHTTPYNELWMNAADENGIGVSFEGTWPWLMILSSMPDSKLIDMWANEFLRVQKKYRNHPSLLFWTVNNEMKFYDNDPNLESAKSKMKIISDIVKKMRVVDSTRPICFDSNYRRNEGKFGSNFFKTIDDGDIDDIHAYINWYDHTIFKQFNGEFQKQNKNQGRPLISQEMSTGYPNNETGHPTRSYTMLHQTPQELIGDLAYDYADPNAFLDVQSFITGELAEALRRSNEKASGILHFALLTWFRNVYDADKIEPYPTYFALKRALQPVLVSAEIWGRHFYEGEKLPIRICVVNDKEDGSLLQPTTLNWKLVDNNGIEMISGKELLPSVAHSGRQWISPSISIPNNLSQVKTSGKLILELTENGKVVSSNEYKLLFAQKTWVKSAIKDKKIVLVDFNDMKKSLDFIEVKNLVTVNVSDALKLKSDLLILSGLDQEKNVSISEINSIKNYIAKGGKVLLLGSEKVAKLMYPEYITGWIVPTEGDIANLEIPESSIFNGIDELELRYFNNNKREIPTICSVSFKVNRDPKLELLASQTKIHGYINGEMDERSESMKMMKGYPLLKLTNNGSIIISTMSVSKTTTDPIAGRLLLNMINNLIK